jgi:hypothetical protein
MQMRTRKCRRRLESVQDFAQDIPMLVDSTRHRIKNLKRPVTHNLSVQPTPSFPAQLSPSLTLFKCSILPSCRPSQRI